MKEKTLNIRKMIMTIGAIICIVICILCNESKLATTVGGVALGMHIMLLIDIFYNSRKKS